MVPHEILIRPVISEKNTLLNLQDQYIFEVDERANKIMVRQAVEELFKVTVLGVNILHVPGKRKMSYSRKGGRSAGTTRSWKKAIVTLKPGDRIELFQGV
jgi:large subunit ribosomal protein L23